MNNNAWFKKENPFQTVIGYGGGATGFGAHSSVASKLYVDDVFSTNVWIGNETARNITNNINLTKGGLVWAKSRNDTHDYHLADTVRGANQIMMSNDTAADATLANRITAFNSDGFTLGTAGQVNGTSAYNYAGWTFRKAKGFCDIVSYSGNGVAGRTISHGLGCVPGLIIIKSTTDATSWFTYHRELGPSDYVMLNHQNAEAVGHSWFMNDTAPTSSVFSLGTSTNVNGSGRDYIAYIFAGGESTAATAKSVDFDGSNDYLSIPDNAAWDISSSDATVECWAKFDTHNGHDGIIHNFHSTGLPGNGTSGWGLEPVGQSLSVYWGTTGGSYGQVDGAKIPLGQWQHMAFTKSGSTITIYQDGVKTGSGTISGTMNSGSPNPLQIGGNCVGEYVDGKVSNVRITKGQVLYTSNFTPSTIPLTTTSQGATASNVKLLCCNDSSATGSTVTPDTITNNNGATASTDSSFDDTDGFQFGADSDNLEGIIKTGSYIGNSTANREVYLGWEPQYWLVKNVTDSSNWQLLDSMRGWVYDGNDEYLAPNNNTAESGYNFGNPISTGFNLSSASSNWQNESGKTYIYMAIRRPDGVVGKPPSAGTDVFTMDTGAGGSTMPQYDSGFPVDFALYRLPASTSDWWVNARLVQGQELKTNDTSAQSSWAGSKFDSNAGWAASGSGSTQQSWMFKRGQGMDVVTYIGDATWGRGIPHSLNQVPEMMWLKQTNTSGEEWVVYHKGLNGGTNPEQYYMFLHSDTAEADGDWAWSDTAPTSTHFTVGGGNSVNGTNDSQIAFLFASANDENGNPISKVGYYAGSASGQTITTGFQPRFIIIRSTSNGRNWVTFDTLRGWGPGNDEELSINKSDAQGGNNDRGEPTATGFTVGTGNDDTNASGMNYIYYAHA